MAEFYPICTQGREGVIHIIHIVFNLSIFAVAHQRGSSARHLHPNLMMTACFQADFQHFQVIHPL